MRVIVIIFLKTKMQTEERTELHHFFNGLTVVELASVLAGPAVGQFFAELGARVIKIENKSAGGDVTRRWKAPTEDATTADSAYYHSVNWGKESHLLDLHDLVDREQVLRWIAEADIVVSNYRPASASRLGMDYAQLRQRNPTLIYAEITGYGSDDPRPAFDVVLQAESGFLLMTGEAGRPPVKMPVALIDLLAAHQLKQACLVALLRRQQTRQGAYLRVSLYDAAVSSLANQATNWLIAGYEPRRMGTQHPNIAPYGDLFTTADGKSLVLAVGSEGQFAALCRVLSLPKLVTDHRFECNQQRILHREALNQVLATAIGSREREELLQALHAHQVPAGALRTIPEVFADAKSRRLLLQQKDAEGKTVESVKTVVFEAKW
jgi:crotonobetainyl-CoA:carnitine CoA-transferase CaiB-like acyl-CoA transferase